jgi:sporulation protein YlmC with PRC-barrel domain
MRRIQPEIGSEVIDKDGITGVVSKVILNPRNRLVSHLLIDKYEIIQGTRIKRELIVPIEDVDSARAGSIWLKQHLSIDRLLPADASQFSSPPEGWRPPFPYKLDQVLWMREFYPSSQDKLA